MSGIHTIINSINRIVDRPIIHLTRNEFHEGCKIYCAKCLSTDFTISFNTVDEFRDLYKQHKSKVRSSNILILTPMAYEHIDIIKNYDGKTYEFMFGSGSHEWKNEAYSIKHVQFINLDFFSDHIVPYVKSYDNSVRIDYMMEEIFVNDFDIAQFTKIKFPEQVSIRTIFPL